ncbi:MAG: methyltransferase domain-containing protein [Bryobacteraceae bacterium]
MLLCTVRECRLPLHRESRRLTCAAGHSFDVARSGYVNLLQPQDKRSRNPGDTADAVKARRRLHDLGITAPLLQGIADAARLTANDVVLDAGCGEGFYLGSLAANTSCRAHGVDISIPAVDAAARRYPGCEWIVANADRYIPYPDASFTVVLSITARMNSPEFARVLQSGGHLIVALAAPDDLQEIRGAGRDRIQRTVESFAQEFDLIEQSRATSIADLDAAAVQDVLFSIYRPMRSEPPAAMRLTFSLDLLRFRKK